MRYNRTYYVFLAIFFLGFFGKTIYDSNNGYKKSLNEEFYGKVEKIRYDEKKLPYLTINGKEYYIGISIWDNNDSIDLGDFVTKRKGEMFLTVRKKNAKVIIVKP